MAECVTRTLDAMGWGGLYDETDGGFHRCAMNADWTEPQPGKLLSTNAALLDLYLEAGTTLENERWLARAADLVEFIQGTLAIGPGEGWRASTESDATRFSDANAIAVSSLLRASQCVRRRLAAAARACSRSKPWCCRPIGPARASRIVPAVFAGCSPTTSR